MNEALNEFHEKITVLHKDVIEFIKHIEGIEIPSVLRKSITNFNEHIKIYNNLENFNDEEDVALKAKNVAVFAMTIGQAIPRFPEADETTIKSGKKILDFARDLRQQIENTPLNYKTINSDGFVMENINNTKTLDAKNELQLIIYEINNHEQRIKKSLHEYDIRQMNFESNLDKLENEVTSVLEKTSKLYDISVEQFDEKKQQIDSILGHVSGRAIAGDFESSASNEKKMANWLRYGSLFCMFLIICVVSYSFYETTQENFAWDRSVFRIALAFFLSVPAAYLARESAKHREQEYNHLQTSLDLKTITPYISSLPEEEQHKLKISIANRLFAARDFSKFGNDSYPINAQEIIMEIIKKLDTNKQSS